MSPEQKGASLSRYDYVLKVFQGDRALTKEMGKKTVAVCRPNRTKKEFPIGVIFVTDRIHAEGLDAQKLGKYGVIEWAERLLIDKEAGPITVVPPAVYEPSAPSRRRNGGPKKAKSKAPKEKKRTSRQWMFEPGKKPSRRATRPKNAAIANPQAIEPENAGAAADKELPPQAVLTPEPAAQPVKEPEAKPPPVEESKPAEDAPKPTTVSVTKALERTIGLFQPLRAYDLNLSDKPSLDFVRRWIPYIPGVVILSNLSSVAQLLQPFIKIGDEDAKAIEQIINNLIDEIHRRTVLNAEEATAHAG